MDLNQEQTSGPNEDAPSKVAVSGANNRLLGAALGGAVGILASRLLGVPPKVGATIGSLVGANAEKIGPHLFPGRDTGRIEGESAPRDSDAEPGPAAPSTKDLLRELAAERGSDALPKSLQDVLDEYLTLEEDEESIVPGVEKAQPVTKEVDTASTSILDSEVEDSVPLQLHKEAKAKPEPPVTDIEDLPIAPPLEAPKGDTSLTDEPADPSYFAKQKTGKPKSDKDEAPIKPKKISVGQAPPTFPSGPKVEAPKVEAPKVEAPKVEAPKVEASKVEAPKVEAPKVESPVGGQRTDNSESPSVAPFRSSPPGGTPAKEDSNLNLAGQSQSVSTPAAGQASETAKAEASDRSDVPEVSEKKGITNLFSDTSSTASPAIAESGQAKLNPEAEGAKATVVESLWSRPPSTVEDAGDDDDSVLSAPGVPEQDSTAKNPDLLSDRGKSSISQKDPGSNLDVRGEQESISEKPEQTDTAAPPPAEAGVSVFKGTSPIFGAKESSPSPVAEKSDQPKLGSAQSLSAPVSGSSASATSPAQSSPPAQEEEKSVPPTEQASPGGVQTDRLKTPKISASPSSRLASAPPVVSPKAENKQAPPVSGAGITPPKAPLFRPAPKPLSSPPAAADPSAKAPRVAPAKQAPPIVSPPTQQSTPAFAPAAPGTASPIAKSVAPPSAEKAKKDAPVFPAVKQPGAATTPPASGAPGAGAPGVAKPALFTTIPAVAPEIVSGAKTILPSAKTGAPPATPPEEAMPAKPAVSLSATQTIEPTGEAAMSRLFKTADPQPGAPAPDANAPGSSGAPFAEAKKTNNPFKSAPPAENQQATEAEPPTARKPSTTQGPNPFMSSSKPSKTGETTSAAAPPPLPGGAPANDLGTTAAPFKSAGKGAVNPFLTPKKESEEAAPPSAETPSPEAPPEETDIGIKASPAAPAAEVKPPNLPGEAAPINPPGETSKPKWRKASTGADEKDGKVSLVASSQKLETKEAKGAVVEGAPSTSTAETAVVKKPEKAGKDKAKVKSSAPASKGGLGRKLLILSFPVVAVGLGAAAIALKPVITNLVSQASSGMFTPEMVPANDPLAPDAGESTRLETPAMGLPDNAVAPGKADSNLHTGDGGVLPPVVEEPVGDAAEAVSIPEGAVVQILPAGDVPGQPDSSVTLPVDPEENVMVDGIVDPIVKEFEAAKNVVRSLLLSSSTQEASQWVHDSEATEQMMKLYYGSSGLTPTESLAIDLVNAGTVPGSERNAYLMKVTSPDHPEGFPVSIEQTPDGYKVDWEAYIQCKDRLLEKFYTSKPSIPESFYVTLKRSHHFAPEGATAEAKVLSNKLCFKVSSPLPTDPSQYVYADLNSVVGKELEARIKWNKVYFPVVELEWVPADGQHNGYMRISKFVRDTWRKAR